VNNPIETRDDSKRQERRRHPHLRNLYEEARRHLDHIFRDRPTPADSQAEIEALRIMQERYPNLGSDDIRILVAAIQRVHEVLDGAGVAS
jgi:hypothetical protein